ncbi:MAG: hypothetical protein H0V04_08520 [Chloroflexi bacterium]|nr:hypothetical protein [Chloroflexota bacterium]
MTDQRWRGAMIGLGALLALLVAAAVLFLVLSQGRPSASLTPSLSESPSPSASVSASPSASVGPSPSAIPSPSATPSPTPEVTSTPEPTPTPEPILSPTPDVTPSPALSPTPEPTAAPGPTPEPTVAPTVPPTSSPTPPPPTADEASIRFAQAGLDGPAADNPRERLFTFRSEGPGEVRATLSNVTGGEARMCLWRGGPDDVRDQTCRDMRRGSLTGSTTSAGGTTWTVSLIGSEGPAGPTADLTLTFRDDSPSVTIDGLRFQGTAFPAYNGFTATFESGGAGRFALDARWRGGAQPFHLRIDDVDGDSNVDDVTGQGESVQYDTELPATSTYRVRFENQVEVAEQLLFLRATLDWP